MLAWPGKSDGGVGGQGGGREPGERCSEPARGKLVFPCFIYSCSDILSVVVALAAQEQQQPQLGFEVLLLTTATTLQLGSGNI